MLRTEEEIKLIEYRKKTFKYGIIFLIIIMSVFNVCTVIILIIFMIIGIFR
jgi:hypothetical protein